MNHIEKNCKKIILDTCTFSNILHSNIGKEELAAIKLTLLQDGVLTISYLTFSELVEGCNTIEEFELLRKEIDEFQYYLLGHEKRIKKYFNYAKMSQITDKSLNKYKKTILNIKNVMCKKIFASIVYKYYVLFFNIMKTNYNIFWGEICDNFKFSNLKDYNKLISCFFDALLLTKGTNEDVLFEIAKVLSQVYINKYSNKYSEDDVISFFKDEYSKKSLSRLTSKYLNTIEQDFKIINKDFNSNNNIVILMMILRLFDKNDDNYSMVLHDAINYAVVNSGFCKGKFKYNDLIDLYNCSLVGLGNECEYFTNDRKWKQFFDIESKLNKSINGGKRHV